MDIVTAFNIALKADLPTITRLCQTKKRFYNDICNNDDFWHLKFAKDYRYYEDLESGDNPEWSPYELGSTWKEIYMELTAELRGVSQAENIVLEGPKYQGIIVEISPTSAIIDHDERDPKDTYKLPLYRILKQYYSTDHLDVPSKAIEFFTDHDEPITPNNMMELLMKLRKYDGTFEVVDMNV
jgi:hypothetical protein